ncbi:MAG: cytochrome c-type biogenesis protein CcmE [marine bacterium B5-7]|nr:MAG: cytochrome c-type biogenesis protein CcmE [marine bacterium B5-7]
MKAKRKQRLILVALLLAGIGFAVTFALLALKENINLFFSPTQVAAGEAPTDNTFRLGGMVVEGSVKREPGNIEVQFDLTDTANGINVVYAGILPDLFREGQGIVATGRLQNNGVFRADEVLAKHDENYMPPEVAEALEKAHKTVSVQ